MVRRRTLLAGLGALPGVRFATAMGVADVSADSLPTGPAQLSGIPENPAHRFIMVNHSDPALQQRNGWEEADRDRVIDELLDLDPSVFDVLNLIGFRGPPEEVGVPPRSKVARSVAYEYGYPWGVGVHYTIQEQLHDHWYSELPQEEKWRHPDGSVVEHPAELAAADFRGQNRRRGHDGGPIIPSIFADGTRDRLARTGRDIFELGANHFWVDAAVGGLTFGFDYSHWATAAFEEHLRSLSADRRDHLGVSDPETVDIVEYLRENDLSPGATEVPVRDPLYREFVRFQHERQKEFVDELFSGARAELPPEVADAGTAVSSLGFGLQQQRLNPACIYIGDAVDVISIETKPTVPPDRPHDLSVKVGRAVGRFEKPVRVWGRMNQKFGTMAGLDPERYYPTLMRVQMAQAYAHGGRRNIPLTSLPDVTYEESVNSWMRPDGSISDRLQQFVEFVRAHRRLLTDVQEANRTAVAVSLPTLVWQRQPDHGPRIAAHSKSLHDAAQVLRRAHVPYDAVILDYPPLWAAPDQTASLPEYDLLVLPGVKCVSDAHAEAVEAALDDDTTVIATGRVPERTADYEPRDDIRGTLEDAPTGILVADDSHAGGGGSGDTLADAIPADAPRLGLETEADISLNTFRQTAPSRFVVHLVNFEYDRDRDAVETVTDLELSVADPPFSPAVARYYTMDGVQEVAVEQSGETLSVQIPELAVWGFVAFGGADGGLDPEVTESAATRTLADARDRLAAADETTVASRLAQAKLGNAEQVLEYDAYDIARELASEAHSLLEPLETDEGPTETAGDGSSGGETVGGDTDGENTPGVDGPGFGVMSALAGIAGARYLANRFGERGTDEDS